MQTRKATVKYTHFSLLGFGGQELTALTENPSSLSHVYRVLQTAPD